MAKTPEDDLPLAPQYIRMLAKAVGVVGRNRVAAHAGIDPSTVHRNVKEGNLTYTTAMKLKTAIDEIRFEDTRDGVSDDDLPPAIPPPVVAVLGVEHHAWIQAGEALLVEDPAAFFKLLRDAQSELAHARLKSSLSHPLRNPDEK